MLYPPPKLRSYAYSFVKFKTLPFSLLWALTTVSFPSSAADSIDGNNSNGQVHLTGGEYREIVGLGSTVTIGSTSENQILSSAHVELEGVIAHDVYGIANFQSASFGSVITVQSLDSTVLIRNGSTTGPDSEIYGAIATADGSMSTVHTLASGTTLSIYDSDLQGIVWGQLAQTYPMHADATLEARNANVLLEGSSLTGYVLGNAASGYITPASAQYIVTNGSTTIRDTRITGDTPTGVVDGTVAVVGGYMLPYLAEGSGSFSSNSVSIEGDSDITGGVYGALAELNGSSFTNFTAQGNTVVIRSGTIDGKIVGAAVATYDGSVESAVLTSNSVVLRGGTDLSKADLMGYEVTGSIVSIETSGNALVVDGYKGTVNSINRFDRIVFQNVVWENEGTVLEVLNENATSDLSDSGIEIAESTTLAGGTSLQEGDYMYFVRTAEEHDFGTDPGNVTSGESIFTAGVAFEGSGEVQVDPNGSVKYVITDVRTTDQSDNVAAMNTASQAFLLQANDLVVDGLNALERDQLFGTKLFAVGEGAYSKYDVADDLKINGWNGLVGTGDIARKKDGDLSWAVFFEFGDANSRFHFDFGDTSHRTDSEFHYRGGGLALRYRSNNGWYWDVSARGGMIHTKAENAFLNGNGEFFDHDLRTDYWSAHAGIGRVFETNETDELDVFARFFYTHFGDNSFRVDADRFELDSVQSEQLRTGLRWTFNKNDALKWYLGTALEYEFDGKATGSANGVDLRSAALDGATGYAELGIRYQKTPESPWDFEARVRGYVGVRDGVSGVVRGTYTFD